MLYVTITTAFLITDSYMVSEPGFDNQYIKSYIILYISRFNVNETDYILIMTK